jgi:hypothetical protein
MENPEIFDFQSPIKDYRPGDTMSCTIQGKLPGGYALKLPNRDIREAFLPTSLPLRPGDRVEVFYVCTDGKRIFLSMTEEEFRRRMRARAEHVKQARD